jgi:hypothetical protein
MKKYLHLIFFILITNVVFAQARLILNNGGIVNITNNAFVVIDNPAANAITRNTAGHIISEGELNRLKWNIGTTAASYIVPFGRGAAEYLPISFSTSGAAGAGSSLTFAMYGGNWQNTSYLPTGITNFISNYNFDNSTFSVDRFWRIEPTGYTTKPALNNLIFTYRDIEHTVANNSIIESNLIAQRYNGSLNSWDDYMPATTINSVSNTATVASLPSAQLYTWWTLVDSRFVLPIELTAFNGKCDGDKILLNWTTASESNNNYFELERSADGINFVAIEKINSQNSNSTQPLNYTTVDNQLLNGKSYYRLKQVDIDGQYSYSSLVIVNCTNSVTASPVVTIFPNPVSENLTLNILGLPGKKTIMIYDVLGQEMMNNIIMSEDDNIQQVLDVSSLAKATYILRLDVNNELFQILKFVKN